MLRVKGGTVTVLLDFLWLPARKRADRKHCWFFFFYIFRGRFQNLRELQNGMSAIHFTRVAARFPAFRNGERFPYLMPDIHQKLVASKMGCLLSPWLR